VRDPPRRGCNRDTAEPQREHQCEQPAADDQLEAPPGGAVARG